MLNGKWFPPRQQIGTGGNQYPIYPPFPYSDFWSEGWVVWGGGGGIKKVFLRKIILSHFMFLHVLCYFQDLKGCQLKYTIICRGCWGGMGGVGVYKILQKYKYIYIYIFRKPILYHFMFYSRFRLFPTFFRKKNVRGGGGGGVVKKSKKNLISCL